MIIDKSLPITGVNSKIDSGVIAYQQTISLLGRTSNFRLEMPYINGTTTGLVGSEFARRDVNGFGDFRALLSINLIGAPSMNIEEFRELRLNPRPILGASLMMVAPTGQYDADRLINIGTNRWAMRARLGYSHPLNSKWFLETAAGVWFFADNDEFLGETRKQDPVGAIDFSLIRRFSPGFWGSLDLNYYFGGRTATSSEILSIIQAALSAISYDEAAGELSEYHFQRRIKRSRTEVVSIDIQQLTDAELLTGTEAANNRCRWNKSRIAEDLVKKYDLCMQTARMIASMVEEKIAIVKVNPPAPHGSQRKCNDR